MRSSQDKHGRPDTTGPNRTPPGRSLKSGDSETDHRVYWLAAGLAVIFLASAFFVTVAPRNIDETHYILMAEAAGDGRLTINNGYDLYPGEALKSEMMRVGPMGLVPQYPGGYGFMVQPFYAFGGTRGLVLLNMIGYLLTMALTYGLSRQLGASQRVSAGAALIFGFASFSMPYSYGIWPHSISLALVTGSLVSIIAASQSVNARKAAMLATGAGLLIGIGINLRVDTILLAPPVLLWLAGQRDHWAKGIFYIVGLVPGLLFASWLNYLKFGSFVPISYGSDGSGDAAVATYWPLVPLALSAAIAALTLSNPRIRALCTARNLAALASAILVAVLALEPLRDILVRSATGFYALVIDFQTYEPAVGEAPAFSRSPGGHLLLAGLVKRALLQSLPWLGILPLTLLFWRTRKALLVLLALVVACWIAPFTLTSFHGGGAPHMRYFLPILPPVSALAAMCFSRLWVHAKIGRRSGLRLILWTTTFACIAMLVIVLGVANLNSLALSFTTWGALTMAAMLAITMLAMVSIQRRGVLRTARVGVGLAIACLIWSGGSSLLYDLLTDRLIRGASLTANEAASQIDDGVLLITGRSAQFMPQLLRKDSHVAFPNVEVSNVERALIDYHLGIGNLVYVDGRFSEQILPALGSPAYETQTVNFDNLVLIELRPPQ